MRKAIKTVSSILFCLMFVVTAFFVVMKFLGETPSFFGYNVYYILTGSMEPELSAGDIIIGKQTDHSELCVGDIITYNGMEGQTKDKIITHKIIEINDSNGEPEFITKGDANEIEDPPVAADQIISKMVLKVPLAGKMFSAVNSRFGFLLIIILPLVLLLVSEIISLIKVCKNMREEEQIEKQSIQLDE